MYTEKFIDLVEKSNINSKNFYSNILNIEEPNPYYIGYGNPNSKILILGKEKGFDKSNLLQLKYESIDNPMQWKYYTDNLFPMNTKKFYENTNYVNVFIPYRGKQKSGHTWTKYSILNKLIFSTKNEEYQDFFKTSFISEINYKPSKLSNIKNFKDEKRIEFLKHSYFKSFKVIILACGDYLNSVKIQEIFNVKLCENKSKSREKLVVYKNNNFILINARQLSMDVKNEYLERISEIVKHYM
ncbi:hypothetical protein SAMN05444372_1217 [Flavobacterium micromati]|jgi:hypothetical protein|uniref:Uracil DNA glycosylase superfamily protein n=1 Tax=Flavobacterium micromati TaxID=229205 RepID=A0A1M5QYU0_9FLAO|nr:hypothetical protein [Flavobacterium micromati]SHH18889.1 hypothetical protein SAMN05444372_1217 [Flavobacterium micromati]